MGGLGLQLRALSPRFDSGENDVQNRCTVTVRTLKQVSVYFHPLDLGGNMLHESGDECFRRVNVP